MTESMDDIVLKNLNKLRVLRAALQMSSGITERGNWAMIMYPRSGNPECAAIDYGAILSNGEFERAIETIEISIGQNDELLVVHYTHP